jgi:tetratricopeptide (TPR) repeat protein
LGFLTSLILADSNPTASLKVFEEWLRSNISQLPPHYVEPTITVMVWQLLCFDMAKEAARWAAVGIRFARAKGWPRWTSPFYSYRTLALARLGKLEAASICIRRAEENADEACYGTPAWLAWANGLISRARGDSDSATHYLKQSIDLFNNMNDRFRAQQVETDLRELPATTPIT